jgi:hypothetical protein
MGMSRVFGQEKKTGHIKHGYEPEKAGITISGHKSKANFHLIGAHY